MNGLSHHLPSLSTRGPCQWGVALQTAMSLQKMKFGTGRNSQAADGGRFVIPMGDSLIFSFRSAEDCNIRATSLRENHDCKCAPVKYGNTIIPLGFRGAHFHPFPGLPRSVPVEGPYGQMLLQNQALPSLSHLLGKVLGLCPYPLPTPPHPTVCLP